jgi:hypothetical protein
MVQHGDRTRASQAYLDLVHTPLRHLPALMVQGRRPDLEALCGWEWRGTNLPMTSRLLGIRRFIKGFVSVDGRGEGYNVSVEGSDLGAPWVERRQRDGRREWARFAVTPLDGTAPGARYPDAVLLDYGAVGSPERGVARRLRDHVVAMSPDSQDLLLGRAFLRVSRADVPVGWFALERLHPIPEA